MQSPGNCKLPLLLTLVFIIRDDGKPKQASVARDTGTDQLFALFTPIPKVPRQTPSLLSVPVLRLNTAEL